MAENPNARGQIRTYTGKYISVTEPDPKKINIEDIAHALCHIARYNGHYPRFLSVAEHSINVYKNICKRFPNADANMKLHALLHDASEAYLCDLPRPIKKEMKGYYGFEQVFMDIIFERYGIEESKYLKEVEESDALVFDLEWNLWINDQVQQGKAIHNVKEEFLRIFYEVINSRKYEQKSV